MIFAPNASQHVRMRNGKGAVVTGQLQTVDEMLLQGGHRDQACELWKQDGTWSHRDAEHPLDIVTIYTNDGQATAINTAKQPAA